MNIKEYLQGKYRGGAIGLCSKEAKILDVPYPLEKGWATKHSGQVISSEQRAALVQYLELLVASTSKKRCKKGKAQFAKNGLEYLSGSYTFVAPELRPEYAHLIKQKTIKAEKNRRSATYLAKAAQGTPSPLSGDFLQSYEWRRVRMQVLKKYGAICMCCGATAETGDGIHVDHIKPRKLYPELALSMDNLQVLCGACNHGKGNWDMTDWRPKDGQSYDPAPEFAQRFGG